eukprot:TRINITY_DN36447_c0_g1_i1.p1 TRINITY_DN36447_c0_g1~~TRINITY_DN36447_c0_g1_i1.p1  ORF type:complete len:1013 (-),score=176.87 TRINITY_DN36447_c0_g1_i1:220-3258(-)
MEAGLDAQSRVVSRAADGINAQTLTEGMKSLQCQLVSAHKLSLSRLESIIAQLDEYNQTGDGSFLRNGSPGVLKPVSHPLLHGRSRSCEETTISKDCAGITVKPPGEAPPHLAVAQGLGSASDPEAVGCILTVGQAPTIPKPDALTTTAGFGAGQQSEDSMGQHSDLQSEERQTPDDIISLETDSHPNGNTDLTNCSPVSGCREKPEASPAGRYGTSLLVASVKIGGDEGNRRSSAPAGAPALGSGVPRLSVRSCLSSAADAANGADKRRWSRVSISPDGRLSVKSGGPGRGSKASQDWLSSEASEEVAFEVLPAWLNSKWRKTRRTQTMGDEGVMGQSSSMKLEAVQRFLPVMAGADGGNATTMQMGSLENDNGNRSMSFDGVLNQEGCRMHLIIRPTSTRLLMWQLLGACLLMQVFLTVPMEIYVADSWQQEVNFEAVCMAYWILDIILMFFTAFLDDANGVMQTNYRRIATRYCYSWLSFDLACLGVDMVAMVVALKVRRLTGWSYALRGAKLLRCAKIVRLSRSPALESNSREEVFLFLHIVQKTFGLVAVAHVIGCVWYALGLTAEDKLGWTSSFDGSQGVADRHIVCLHWALAQFVGEPIIQPSNTPERFFSMIVLFSTYIMSGFFVSSIVTALARIQHINALYSTQMDAVRRYIAENDVPTGLAVRVLRNASHVYEKSRTSQPEESVELLAKLSGPLLVELHFNVRGRLLMQFPFFMHYCDVNPGGIEQVCHRAVTYSRDVHQGDVVFSSHLEAKFMYFVGKGFLSYRKEGQVTKMVKQGSWAAEGALWTHWVHCGSLSAEVDCLMIQVSPERVVETLGPFPTQHAQLYAAAFVQKLNTLEACQITDLRFSKDVELDFLVVPFPQLLQSESESCISNEDEKEKGGSGGRNNRKGSLIHSIVLTGASAFAQGRGSLQRGSLASAAGGKLSLKVSPATGGADGRRLSKVSKTSSSPRNTSHYNDAPASPASTVHNHLDVYDGKRGDSKSTNRTVGSGINPRGAHEVH